MLDLRPIPAIEHLAALGTNDQVFAFVIGAYAGAELINIQSASAAAGAELIDQRA